MKRLAPALAFALAALAAAACTPPAAPPARPAPAAPSPPPAPAAPPPRADQGDQGALDAVAAVHGGAGPWAVAGYRMGRFALQKLGLPRGSFDLEVVHATPREVQYACVADGAAAATGASLGKLNLTLDEAPAAETRTLYRRRSTGQTLVLRPSGAFRARFLNVPRARLAEAGREVLGLRDDEIFEPAP